MRIYREAAFSIGEKIVAQNQFFIDGTWTDQKKCLFFDVIDPTTEEGLHKLRPAAPMTLTLLSTPLVAHFPGIQEPVETKGYCC